MISSQSVHQGLELLTPSWEKNWDSHSLVNGYPSFYPRIALVAPSPGGLMKDMINSNCYRFCQLDCPHSMQ